MTKYLCRIEVDRIKMYRLKRGPRQMVSVSSRLYRTDDDYMMKDDRTDTAMAVYRIDSTQPRLPEAVMVDPDMTKVYIDSAKMAGTKKSIWATLDTSKITELLMAVMVVGIVAYSLLTRGGM